MSFAVACKGIELTQRVAWVVYQLSLAGQGQMAQPDHDRRQGHSYSDTEVA